MKQTVFQQLTRQESQKRVPKEKRSLSTRFLYFLHHSDIYFLGTITTSLFTVILITITYLVLFKLLPTQLPLFYSHPWGDTQLVSKQQFFILPAIVGLITLINTTLAWQLHPSQIVLKRILLLSVPVADMIMLITAYQIVTLFV